ncbi:MAG: mechanosensitive ion channel family protein [Prochlorothrix sp.]|nr:mechanosensitive ion channel domain-containing protein [Prochlorothrix sp.]
MTLSLATPLLSWVFPWGIGRILHHWVNPTVSSSYTTLADSQKNLNQSVVFLAISENLLALAPSTPLVQEIELICSLTLSVSIAVLLTRMLRQLSDTYLVDIAFRGGRKLNSEVLIIGRLLLNIVVVVLIFIVFAQAHQFNIIGLFASLGLGGIAIAFAAQKTLEQLLGSIVLYLDRPFTVDDYISLSDGTFGRVESIGLRSTKVRLSGKGTLKVIPNSTLAGESIENFTGAKKVMSLLYLNFYQDLGDQDKALVRQVVFNSSQNISGIDSQGTNVVFRTLEHLNRSQYQTQAQITFFILGSGDVSMEFRRQLLDFAGQEIRRRLQEYGIEFAIEEPTIYVDSPITV